MDNITTLLSKVETIEELSIWIKQRNVNQKFIYMGLWAKTYYDSVSSLTTKTPTLYTARNFYRSFIKNKISKDEKIALISLWCGDARQEKDVLKKLYEDKYNIEYFAVDSSKSMLELANDNLKDIWYKKHFLLADIMSVEFKEKVIKIKKDFDKIIVAFLWCTFVNHNQTQIADTLYNMLKKDDLLRFDVFARPDTSQNSDYKIFKIYENILKNEKMLNFFFFALKNLGVSLSDGEIKMITKKEESIWALLINFYFKLKKDLNIKVKDEIIHLRAKQEISLLDVRAYDTETVVKFFEWNEFETIKYETEKQEWPLYKSQFLFKIK